MRCRRHQDMSSGNMFRFEKPTSCREGRRSIHRPRATDLNTVESEKRNRKWPGVVRKASSYDGVVTATVRQLKCLLDPVVDMPPPPVIMFRFIAWYTIERNVDYASTVRESRSCIGLLRGVSPLGHSSDEWAPRRGKVAPQVMGSTSHCAGDACGGRGVAGARHVRIVLCQMERQIVAVTRSSDTAIPPACGLFGASSRNAISPR